MRLPPIVTPSRSVRTSGRVKVFPSSAAAFQTRSGIERSNRNRDRAVEV